MAFPLEESLLPSAVETILFFISLFVIINSRTRCAMKRAAVPSILVAVVFLAVAVIAEAQQPKKVARIGYLTPNRSY